MTAKQPVLEVYGLRKRVKGQDLVKDITFQIHEGEIFGFLGPNGAGKTTTIRMLVGLIRPTSGKIVINGFDLRKDFLSAMKHVGCIVENPDLYPYLTGYENLLQLARMQGPQAVARIDQVVEQVRLSERIHDRVKTYSLGMKQRLGIAQALLNEPKLLILDEPTNGLDPTGIRELRMFIRGLAQEGMSVLISSHLLSEVELLCDRVAMIRDGQVVRTGRVKELLAHNSPEVVWRVNPLHAAAEILARHSMGQPVIHWEEETVVCTMSDSGVEEAVRELAAKECKVYEIVRRKATLEDVFLQTTGDEPYDAIRPPRIE
jgi:ABC-2 type transport system ATP-binding protein